MMVKGWTLVLLREREQEETPRKRFFKQGQSRFPATNGKHVAEHPSKTCLAALEKQEPGLKTS